MRIGRRGASASRRWVMTGVVAHGRQRHAGMLSRDQTMDILLLRKQGHSIGEIARQSGHSRNTVRRALREAAPHSFRRVQRAQYFNPLWHPPDEPKCS